MRLLGGVLKKWAAVAGLHVDYGATTMNDFSICAKCAYETADVTARFCTLCGGQMVSSQKMKRLGWVALIAGAVLVSLVIFIVLWIKVSDARWEGTDEMAMLAIIMGFVLFTLGVVSIVGGVWQIKYGRRNKIVMYLTAGLAAAAVAIAYAIRHSRSD